LLEFHSELALIINLRPKPPIIKLTRRSKTVFEFKYTLLGVLEDKTKATIEYQLASSINSIRTKISTREIDKFSGSKAAKTFP